MRKSKNTPTESELIQRLDGAFEKRGMGNHADALHEFEALERLSIHPKDISALRLYQAYCLIDMGKPDGALIRITAVDHRDLESPLHAIYEYHFARVLHALGRAQDALLYVERARRMFGALSKELVDAAIAASAETLMGLLLAECKRCNEALPLLKNVTIHDLDWGYAKLRSGDCYMEMGQYHDAIECYLTLLSSDLKINPVVRTDAVRNAGCAYYWLGDYVKSIEYLSRVRDAYKEYPELEERVLSFMNSAEWHLKKLQCASKVGR